MHKKIFTFILFAAVAQLGAATNISISHLPVTRFGYPGHAITFRATLSESSCTVTSVTLFIRKQGDLYFKGQAMATNGSLTNFLAISSNASAEGQYEYFIQVVDNFYNYYWMPSRDSGQIRYYALNNSPFIEESVSPSSSVLLALPDDHPEDESYTGIKIPANSISTNLVMGIRNFAANLPSGVQAPSWFIPVTTYQLYAGGSSHPLSAVFSSALSARFVYFDDNKDGIVDGTSISASQLTVAWYDGNYWFPLTSRLDLSNHILATAVDHTGIFSIGKIVSAPPNPDSTIINHVSHPIFQPEQGEVCVFGIKPGITVFKIVIMRQDGRTIRELTTDSWDGRDSSGNRVEGGVYLYRITANGKSINGFIAVRK